MPGERELQCGNVPTAQAEEESAAAEWRSLPVAPECLARACAGNAVSREPRPQLELADGAFGPWPEDAVDGAPVHPVFAEPNLERGDLRVSCISAARVSATRESERQQAEHRESGHETPHQVQNRRHMLFNHPPKGGTRTRD